MSKWYDITDDIGIYGIFVDEKLVYIGSTVSFANRFKQHKDRTLNENYKRQPLLYNYLREHIGHIQCRVIHRMSD